MLIDVNCSLGTWPFRQLPVRTAEDLARRLGAEGVEAAFVSSLEAPFHNDPDAANRALLASVDGAGESAAGAASPADRASLFPIPVINPRIRNWRTALEEYAANERVRAVKLHPNYHRFGLEDGTADDLAGEMERRGMPLMITLRLEDERFHHPSMQVPGVPTDALRAFAGQHPDLRIIVLNAYKNDVRRLNDISNLHFDIAYVEEYNTVRELCAMVPSNRVLFGSHTPLFVTRAASMKVAWAEVDEEALSAVAGGNARRLLSIREGA